MTAQLTNTPLKPVARTKARTKAPGRNKGTTILVTGILVVAALYFLAPVYWVVVA